MYMLTDVVVTILCVIVAHPAGSGSQRVRANLYGALLYYLQIAQKPSMLPGESGKELAVVYTAASSLVMNSY